MPFSKFRYTRRAEAGLTALLEQGEEVFDELKEEIQAVQSMWEPEDKDDAEFIVFFREYFLIFTVARSDHSCLILAAVEPQPRL